MTVLVFGLPGSGKSYFASRLATRLNAQYLSSDRLRQELFPKPDYSRSEKSKVYGVLLKKMQEARDHNQDLVLDATFHERETRAPFLAKDKASIIEIRADEKTTRERLKEKRPFSEADQAVYELIKRQWEPMERPHLTLRSTNDNIDVMLQKAMQYLRNDAKTN